MRRLLLLFLCLLSPAMAMAAASAGHAAHEVGMHVHHDGAHATPAAPIARARWQGVTPQQLAADPIRVSCHGLPVASSRGLSGQSDDSGHSTHQGDGCQACHAVCTSHHTTAVTVFPQAPRPAHHAVSLVSADLRQDRRPPRVQLHPTA